MYICIYVYFMCICVYVIYTYIHTYLICNTDQHPLPFGTAPMFGPCTRSRLGSFAPGIFDLFEGFKDLRLISIA